MNKKQLGQCFQHGRGVDADKVEAGRLFRAGAALGEAAAQCALGLCLQRGVGVAVPDRNAAFELFDAAAAQNFVGGLYSLAICYVNGVGVARASARSRIRAARRLLRERFAGILGSVYWDSDGVSRDRELGARYWRQAAALGSMPAARELREQGLAQGLKYRRRGSRPAWVRWNYVGFPRLG